MPALIQILYTAPARPQGSSINGVLDVSVTVTSGAPGPVEWLGTHPTTVVEQQAGSVSLTLDREQVGI